MRKILIMLLFVSFCMPVFASDPNVYDSEDAWAVWHMETADVVYDDDPCNPTRNNDLVFSWTGTSTVPGVAGNAVHFDGASSTIGIADNWPAGKRMLRAELSFKADSDSAPSGYLLSARNIWIVAVTGADVYFYVKDSNSPVQVMHEVIVEDVVDPCSWQHVVATVEYDYIELTVDGQTVSKVLPCPILNQETQFSVGAKWSTGAPYPYPFAGAIDEMKISIPELAALPEDLLEWGLWQMEEVSSGYLLDDDGGTGRDRDLAIGGTPANPTVVSGYDGNAVHMVAGEFAIYRDLDLTGATYVGATAYIKFDKEISEMTGSEYFLCCKEMNLARDTLGRVWFSSTGTSGAIITDANSLEGNTWYEIEASIDRATPSSTLGLARITITDLDNGGTPITGISDISTDWSTPSAFVINMFETGAGPTAAAYDRVSVSRGYECGALGYDPADVNHDCYVDLQDFALLAEKWLQPVHILPEN
jgi:hypothetical protein